MKAEEKEDEAVQKDNEWNVDEVQLTVSMAVHNEGIQPQFQILTPVRRTNIKPITAAKKRQIIIK